MQKTHNTSPQEVNIQQQQQVSQPIQQPLIQYKSPPGPPQDMKKSQIKPSSTKNTTPQLLSHTKIEIKSQLKLLKHIKNDMISQYNNFQQEVVKLINGNKQEQIQSIKEIIESYGLPSDEKLPALEDLINTIELQQKNNKSQSIVITQLQEQIEDMKKQTQGGKISPSSTSPIRYKTNESPNKYQEENTSLLKSKESLTTQNQILQKHYHDKLTSYNTLLTQFNDQTLKLETLEATTNQLQQEILNKDQQIKELFEQYSAYQGQQETVIQTYNDLNQQLLQQVESMRQQIEGNTAVTQAVLTAVNDPFEVAVVTDLQKELIAELTTTNQNLQEEIQKLSKEFEEKEGKYKEKVKVLNSSNMKLLSEDGKSKIKITQFNEQIASLQQNIEDYKLKESQPSSDNQRTNQNQDTQVADLLEKQQKSIKEIDDLTALQNQQQITINNYNDKNQQLQQQVEQMSQQLAFLTIPVVTDSVTTDPQEELKLKIAELTTTNQNLQEEIQKLQNNIANQVKEFEEKEGKYKEKVKVLNSSNMKLLSEDAKSKIKITQFNEQIASLQQNIEDYKLKETQPVVTDPVVTDPRDVVIQNLQSQISQLTTIVTDSHQVEIQNLQSQISELSTINQNLQQIIRESQQNLTNTQQQKDEVQSKLDQFVTQTSSQQCQIQDQITLLQNQIGLLDSENQLLSNENNKLKSAKKEDNDEEEHVKRRGKSHVKQTEVLVTYPVTTDQQEEFKLKIAELTTTNQNLQEEIQKLSKEFEQKEGKYKEKVKVLNSSNMKLLSEDGKSKIKITQFNEQIASLQQNIEDYKLKESQPSVVTQPVEVVTIPVSLVTDLREVEIQNLQSQISELTATISELTTINQNGEKFVQKLQEQQNSTNQQLLDYSEKQKKSSKEIDDLTQINTSLTIELDENMNKISELNQQLQEQQEQFQIISQQTLFIHQQTELLQNQIKSKDSQLQALKETLQNNIEQAKKDEQVQQLLEWHQQQEHQVQSTAQIDQLNTKIVELQGQCNSLSQELEAKNKEIHDLIHQSKHDDEFMIKQDQQQKSLFIETLEKAKKDHAQQLEELNLKMKYIVQIQTSDLNTLKLEAQQKQDSTSLLLQQSLDELKQKDQEYTKKITELEDINHSTQNSLKHARRDFLVLQKDKEQVSSAHQQENQQNQALIQQLQEKYDQLCQNQLSNSKGGDQQLEQQLTQLQEKLVAQEKNNLEMSQLHQLELEDQQSVIQNLQNDLNESLKRIEYLESLQDETDQKNQGIIQTLQQNQNMISSYSEMLKISEERLNYEKVEGDLLRQQELQQQQMLAQLQEKYDQLAQESLQVKSLNLRIVEYEQLIGELNSINEHVSNEYKELQDQTNDLQSCYQETVMKAQQEFEVLNQRIRELEQQVGDLTTLTTTGDLTIQAAQQQKPEIQDEDEQVEHVKRHGKSKNQTKKEVTTELEIPQVESQQNYDQLKEKYDQLYKNNIEMAKEQVNDLEQQYFQMFGQLNQRIKELEQSQGDPKIATQQVDELNQRIMELEQQVCDLKTATQKVDVLNQRIRELEQQVSDLNTQVSYLTTVTQNQSNEYQQLLTQKNDLQQSYEQLSQKSQQEQDILNKMIKEYEQLQGELKTHNKNQSNEYQVLLTQTNDLSSSYQQQVSELALKSQQEIHVLDQRIKELEQQVGDLNTSAKNQSNAYQLLLTQKNDLQSSIARLQQEDSKQKPKIQDEEEQGEQVKRHGKQKKQGKKEVKYEVKTPASELEIPQQPQVVTIVNDSQQDVLNERVRELEQQVGELTTAAQCQQNAYQVLQTQKNDLQSSYDQQAQKLQKVDSLNKKIKELEQTIDDLKKCSLELQTLKGEIAEKQNEVLKQFKKILVLEKQIKENEIFSQKLTTDLEKMKQTNKNLENNLENCKKTNQQNLNETKELKINILKITQINDNLEKNVYFQQKGGLVILVGIFTVLCFILQNQYF